MQMGSTIPEPHHTYSSQFVMPRGQGTITATVSSPSYMSAIPATLMPPVNTLNYTTTNTTSTTFANLGGTCGVGVGTGGGIGMKMMPYTTATLGRPSSSSLARHPASKGTEPSICAQVSQSPGDTFADDERRDDLPEAALILSFQIDLARHQQQHPSLNNPRIPLGQTQMSTFPRAPPQQQMFAAPALGSGAATELMAGTTGSRIHATEDRGRHGNVS